MRLPQFYRRPFLALCVFPAFVFLLWTLGPLDTDQFHLFGNIAVSREPGPLGGIPGVEPNEGITSYALGYRATLDLFSGRLPLWNPYEGFGAPLLGEMQSASLFPFTWLIPLPAGQALERSVLEFVAGLGAFLFFRRYGLGAVAALSGAMTWEVNGTFAWLRNAIFNPVAFLPWLFLAIELMHASARKDSAREPRSTGIAVGAGAGALAVYAGFPEEVYLYSWLLILWVAFRLFALKANQIPTFVANLILTAALAVALSAPALVSFIDVVREGYIGQHADNGFYEVYPHFVFLLIFVLPYAFGPLLAYPPVFFGGLGGYIGLSPILLGIAALGDKRHRATKIFLSVWIVLALGVTIGLPWLYHAFMALPLAHMTGPSRYLNTSWGFSAIFLAALFIDDLATGTAKGTWPLSLRASVILTGAGVAVLAFVNRSELSDFVKAAPANHYALWVAVAAACLMLLVTAAVSAAKHVAHSASILGGVLAVEALVWFLTPYLSYPRSTVLDYGPVRFLQKNTGLQRAMMAEGIGLEPNYGAVFGIPTLNYADLPLPARTASYVKRQLDPYITYVFLFEPGETVRQELFLTKLADYAHVGVKYVVASKTFNDRLAAKGQPPLPIAFEGQASTIYELPAPRPYFSADGCDVVPLSRTRVQLSCDRASKLVRLEVYMDGWRARLNDAPATIGTEDDTFQTIDVPQGSSIITFKYWPPGLTIALMAAAAGLTILIVLGVQGSRRRPAE